MTLPLIARQFLLTFRKVILSIISTPVWLQRFTQLSFFGQLYNDVSEMVCHNRLLSNLNRAFLSFQEIFVSCKESGKLWTSEYFNFLPLPLEVSRQFRKSFITNVSSYHRKVTIYLKLQNICLTILWVHKHEITSFEWHIIYPLRIIFRLFFQIKAQRSMWIGTHVRIINETNHWWLTWLCGILNSNSELFFYLSYWIVHLNRR